MNGFSNKNSVELLKNDDQFISKTVNLIKSARKSIYLQTYIFDVDEVTEPILNALNEKAEEGLIVSVVLDNFGSLDFPISRLHPMIFFKFFSPIFSKGLLSLGRRLHSKVLIIDSSQALVSGINYSKKFNGSKLVKPWLDYGCLLKGEEVYHLSKKFNINSNKKVFSDETSFVKTNINDWSRFKNQIFKSYIKAIK